MKFKFLRLFFGISLLSATISVTVFAQCPGAGGTNGIELVVNGDFSGGNTGFTSEYAYCSSSGCGLSAETYGIVVFASTFHPSMIGNDHTTGSGNFMIANGSFNQNVKVWCETVAVNPNTTYNFSGWLCATWNTGPAKLQVVINDVNIGGIHTAPTAFNEWDPFSEVWNSGSSTSATVCIIDTDANSTDADDFGLDDLSFQECGCGNMQVHAGKDITVAQGSTATLTASGATNYTWSPSKGLSCTACSSPVVTVENTSTYILTGTNTNGCSDSDTITIYIGCGDVLIPNIFTPNDDGKNDRLLIKLDCIENFNLQIFNRWGEQVFESSPLSKWRGAGGEAGWDGKFKDRDLDAGVFVYYLNADLLNGAQVSKIGYITLVR